MSRHVLGVKPTGWTHGKGQDKEASLAGLRIVTRGQVCLNLHKSLQESRFKLSNFLILTDQSAGGALL